MDRKPFYVLLCQPCGHIWIGLYLPMRMDKVAQVLKHQRCPSCASPSTQHFMSDPPSAGAPAPGLLTREGGA